MPNVITDEEFNLMINGPLDHTLYPFKVSRLVLALRAVVDSTGEAGADALRAVCYQRQKDDEAGDQW